MTDMKGMRKSGRLLLVAAVATFVAWTPAAAGERTRYDAQLYEVTESVFIEPDGQGIPLRVATSALSGAARLGTPGCPDWILTFAPRTKQCAVNAVGTSIVPLAGPTPGLGTVSGTVVVVVQDPNRVDAPEMVVQVAEFSGTIDLTPVLSETAPLGTMTATLTIVQAPDGVPVGETFPLAGTFRMPYKADGKPAKHFRGQAFYLNDRGRPVAVEFDERSLGVPTVRLDLTFTD
jgi:hypothetical protein